MEKKELLDNIDKLHNELNKLDKIDSDVLKHVSKISDDIKKLTNSSNADKEQSNEEDNKDKEKELRSQVEDFLLKYEVEHPELSTFINKVSEILSKMGI